MTEVAQQLEAQGKRRLIPQVIGQMRQGAVMPLDEHLTHDAAMVGRQYRLAFANSIMYTTALAVGAWVWTQDADVRNLARVEYRPHRRKGRGA